MAARFPELKPFYYLDHFHEMIRRVEEICPHILSTPEHDFILRFRTLEHSAQALFIRIEGRRSRFVKISALAYTEIPDPAQAIATLNTAGFTAHPDHSEYPEILPTLTKSDLFELLERPAGLASRRKQDLLSLAISNLSEVTSRLDPLKFIRTSREAELGFLRFLYFGKVREDLTSLTLRDLGIVKTGSDGVDLRSRFINRPQAFADFFHSTLAIRLRDAATPDLLALLPEIPRWPVHPDAEPSSASHDFHSSIARLGHRLERSGEVLHAITTYRHSDRHPARERRCRLLHAAGEIKAAKDLLREMIAFPSSDDELLFAEDFLSRKYHRQRLGTLGRMLREAPVILIDEAYRDGAERPAIRHFQAQGWEAWHTENHFWNALFGLTFWDELQGPGVRAHSEFDRRPVSLTDGTFATQNSPAIARKLSLLGTPAAPHLILSTFTRHFGQPNGVFRWREADLPVLIAFLDAAPPAAVRTILSRIARDPRANSTGFPDLLLIRGNSLRFVEIKSEGDQIRRHQLVQLQALREAGFEVGITRVGWCVDPHQEYVVVDIETTGGSADWHRITEIGALKLKNGKVTGTFESLINPARPIPRNITRLTGINDSMVADSPPFSEIADTYEKFTAGAVFVAHSAQFDYGFIRREFARIGRDYRRPVLCTVVAMRKHFPGLPSYSLANLCQEFEITLTRHHRAMADATATSGLLHLINAKRLASTPVPPRVSSAECPPDAAFDRSTAHGSSHP